MKKAISILAVVSFLLMGCSEQDTSTDTSEVKKVVKKSSIFIISLDGSKSFDENYSESLIGCNDKLLEVVVGENLSPQEALDKLFSFENIDFEAGEYNVFELSDELKIVDLSIEEKIAKIELSGHLMIGGTCDFPRVIAQITETLLQYPEVEKVDIYINGDSISDFFSEKD